MLHFGFSSIINAFELKWKHQHEREKKKTVLEVQNSSLNFFFCIFSIWLNKYLLFSLIHKQFDTKPKKIKDKKIVASHTLNVCNEANIYYYIYLFIYLFI